MKARVSHGTLAIWCVVATGLTAGCAEEPAADTPAGRVPARMAPYPTRPPGRSSTHLALNAPDWLPKGKAIKVLFVGNSLTFTNDLPGIVQALAAARGKRLEYMADTPGGTNLDDHW